MSTLQHNDDIRCLYLYFVLMVAIHTVAFLWDAENYEIIIYFISRMQSENQ